MIIAAMEPFLKDAILNKFKSSRALFPRLALLLSQITNSAVAKAEMASDTGITEMPSVGQEKSPIWN